jgi:AMMECR1 domain-containing protein
MVWDSLPDPQQFLAGLKVKAGLPKDYWSDGLTLRRFTAETVEEQEMAGAVNPSAVEGG